MRCLFLLLPVCLATVGCERFDWGGFDDPRIVFGDGTDTAALAGADVPIQVYPANGSAAMRGKLELRVFLDDSHAGLVPEGVLVWDDGELELDCTLSDDGREATCPLFTVAPEDRTFQLDATVGDTALEVEFDSFVPERGLAYNATQAVEVARFGAGDQARNLLEGLFEDADMLTVLESVDGPGAAETRLLFGPAWHRDDDLWTIHTPGLVLSLPALLAEDGTITTATVDSTLVVLSDAGNVPVPVLDASATGSFDEDSYEIHFTAIMPGRSLLALSEGIGINSETALSMIEPDLDTDGDGEADAATVEFTASGPSVQLAAWAEDD